MLDPLSMAQLCTKVIQALAGLLFYRCNKPACRHSLPIEEVNINPDASHSCVMIRGRGRGEVGELFTVTKVGECLCGDNSRHQLLRQQTKMRKTRRLSGVLIFCMAYNLICRAMNDP